VGLDAGWHLRFARVDRMQALIDPATLPQVEDHVFIVGGWDMAVEEQDGALLVTFTRRGGAPGGENAHE
jgi:hypothetical protein